MERECPGCRNRDGRIAHLEQQEADLLTRQRDLEPCRAYMKSWLQDGARCRGAKIARLCGNLLAIEPALWTFLYQQGVEPTHNHTERLPRPGVLWRTNAFGCHSDEGCRFAERILTVVQTPRLQKRPTLDFLYRCLHAQRQGLQAPKLVPAY